MDNTRLVDAIEDGKIVKVSENYAKEEGLPILRRPTISQINQTAPVQKETKTGNRYDFVDYLKKPADWREKQVISELFDNFHWLIRMQRKKKGISRKQLAQIVGEEEETIRTIEYGRLPVRDFVLINKIQKVLGINLRKDQRDFDKPVNKMLESNKPQQQAPSNLQNNLTGNDIEILEDEI